MADLTPAAQQSPDASAALANATASRDVNQLKQIADANKDSPVGKAALESITVIRDGLGKFNDMTSSVDKAGGMQTPEGRMEISKQLSASSHQPNWSQALIKYVLGDEKGAVLDVTGGNVKTKITYDLEGRQILEKRNDLGEFVQDPIDVQSGKTMSLNEYAKRYGGLNQFNETLGYQKAKINLENNLKALNESNQAVNAWTSALGANAPKANEMLRLSDQIKDLPPDLLTAVNQAASRSMSSANTYSQTNTLLDQLSKGQGLSQGQTVSGELAKSLGLGPGVFKWDQSTKSFISQDGKVTKSLNELQQQQSSINFNQQAQDNMSQTQKELATYFRLNKTDSQTQQKVLRYFQLANEIGTDLANTTQKYGKPTFIALPSAADITDPKSKGQIQALTVHMNYDLMNEYKNFYNNNIKSYKANEAPDPGQLEAAFSRTKPYAETQNGYADIVTQILNRQPTQVSPAVPAKPTASVGAKPPEAQVTRNTTFVAPSSSAPPPAAPAVNLNDFFKRRQP